MNRIITTLGLVAVTPCVLFAADTAENLNRFSLGARFGMNLRADFRNDAPIIPVTPGLPIGGVDHQYQDGYVRVDSSGNAGGKTWNWGYENSAQVVGDAMQFHSTQSQSSSLAADNGVNGRPQPGLELVYQRVLGHLPFLASARWGLEVGFGYTDIDLHDNRNATGSTTVTTDTYQLNGSLPPGAGYQGTFPGPGTLLGDTPARSTATYLTAESSQQSLSGQLYTFRLGPFVEWNFTSQLSLAASVGLTLAPAVVDYDFTEYTQAFGTTSGHSSKTSLLYGPYVGGMLRYDFTQHWGIFAGVQFESLTDMQQSIGTHTAHLNPGSLLYGTLGVTWKF